MRRLLIFILIFTAIVTMSHTAFAQEEKIENLKGKKIGQPVRSVQKEKAGIKLKGPDALPLMETRTSSVTPSGTIGGTIQIRISAIGNLRKANQPSQYGETHYLVDKTGQVFLLIKDAGGAILDSALTHDITVTSDKNIQTLPGTNIKMMVSVVSYEINDPPVKGGPVPVLPPEKPPRDLEPIKDAPIEQPGNGVGPAPEDPSRNDQNVRSDAEVIKLIAIRDEKASQRAGVPPGVKIVGEVKRNNEERMPAKE